MIGAVSFYSIMFLIPGIGPNQWALRAIGWGIPYGSMVILNLGQGFVVIFLATGLMKINKKLDTNEVFLARPLSNAEYVLGRVWTLLKLFFGIHVILIIEVLIINLAISDAPLQPMAYLVYPVLMSIPNLLFIIGLSFFMVGLLRNQAVSLILLLGMAGSSLVYLSTEYYFIFDYTAFRLPMLFSDIVGFVDAEFIFMQRGFYAVLGLAFMSLTVLLFNRLPRSKSGPVLAAIIALILFSGAGFIGYKYLQMTSSIPDELRAKTIELNNVYGTKNNVTVQSCDLKLNHGNGDISCVAELVLKNETSEALDTWYVCLNPSLKVISLKSDGKEIEFNRKLHIVEVKNTDKLNPDKTIEVEIEYKGDIEESVAYLQIADKTREQIYQRWLYQIPKRFSFLTPNYLLLTSEVQWYPVTFPGFMSNNQLLNPRDFVEYSLEVKTKKNLTAISQGKVVESDEGTFKFSPENPLSQISLVIGNYEKKSIEVDSISYELYNFKGNDFYSSYFPDLTDTIPDLIREAKSGFEEKMSLTYPFDKLSLVETPVQFFAYRWMDESHQSFVQPEMVLWPEKGGNDYQVNFKRVFRDIDRNTRNQKITKKEKQYRAVKSIVDRMLIPIGSEENGNQGSHSVLPNYYWFSNTLKSDQWPYLDKIIAKYLEPKRVSGVGDRYWSNLSVGEQANRAILGSSLKDFLDSDELPDLKNEILLSRGTMLFAILEKGVGQNEFSAFLRNYLEQYRFENASFENFVETFDVAFKLNLKALLKQVYENADPPSYDISKPELFEVNTDGLSRYQTSITVSNSSEANGALVIKYGEKSDFNGSNTRTDIVKLAPGQTKKINAVLAYEPAISINTIASQNLPMIIGYKAKSLEVKNATTTYDGELILEGEVNEDSNTIIVDNEDDGFSLITNEQETLLDKWTSFEQEEEEEYLPIWRTYRRNKWIKSVDSKFYGRHIRSVHVTRPGEGKKGAIWEAEIKSLGYYDIYAYINESPERFSRRGRDNKKSKTEDLYTVQHEDGEEEVTIDVTKSGHGWALLGSFRLQPGMTEVRLSDKREVSNGYVFADAIKWVKQ
jgi:hypothetical protein